MEARFIQNLQGSQVGCLFLFNLDNRNVNYFETGSKQGELNYFISLLLKLKPDSGILAMCKVVKFQQA